MMVHIGVKKILKSQLKFLCHDDFMEFVLQNSVCQKEGKFREIAEVLWFECKFIIYLSTLFYSFRYSALSVCALWNTEKISLPTFVHLWWIENDFLKSTFHFHRKRNHHWNWYVHWFCKSNNLHLFQFVSVSQNSGSSRAKWNKVNEVLNRFW